jgi:hypothetical protein
MSTQVSVPVAAAAMPRRVERSLTSLVEAALVALAISILFRFTARSPNVPTDATVVSPTRR